MTTDHSAGDVPQSTRQFLPPPPPPIDRRPYLEASPSKSDQYGLIGRDPRTLSTESLRALRQPTSPIKAVRAKCVDCSGGSAAEARKCLAVECPLWAFRMGTNVFRGKGSGHEVEANPSNSEPAIGADFSETEAVSPEIDNG